MELKEQIFKNGSITYYYSSLFFRGQIKEDVFTLYAYVRTIDDFVDTSDPDVMSFNAMKKDTDRVWKGERSTDDIVTSFIELAKRKSFQKKWIDAFWKSMKLDLTKKFYKNYSELEHYMYGSAEVIGLMMARILDLPNEASHAAALQGRAMQFANFVRDVQEDLELGRNYLGYSDQIRTDSSKWNSFIRDKLDIYYQLQEEAEKGYSFIPRNYLVPIKSAADIYKWTANTIYNNPQVVWEKKVKPDKYRVVAQTLLTYLTAK